MGEPRSTIDIDMAISLGAGDIERVIDAARHRFYVPESAARGAAERHESFNLIHNDSAFKADVFVLGTTLLDVRQLERRVTMELSTRPPVTLWVTSPEDQILRKLDWFRSGGGVSDRQWRDVVAILRVCSDTLDNDYLDATACLVDLEELLAEARLVL